MTHRALPAAALAALLMGSGSAAWALGTPLDDNELSTYWGQALLSLTNTSQGGFDFSRITLGADIRLSANFSGLRLGEYSYAPREGTGADIDISRMQFGRSDLTDAQRVVTINNPYFEWVYRNDGTAASREVVGMRMGFGGISGDVGLQMNTVSGSLVINTDANGTINSANDTALGGKRWDGTAGCPTCTLLLSQVGGVTAGDANGASRDFFLSVLKTALVYPTLDAGVGAPAVSQAGFWMNWTDRLKAINVTGSVPPNIPKVGP